MGRASAVGNGVGAVGDDNNQASIRNPPGAFHNSGNSLAQHNLLGIIIQHINMQSLGILKRLSSCYETTSDIFAKKIQQMQTMLIHSVQDGENKVVVVIDAYRTYLHEMHTKIKMKLLIQFYNYWLTTKCFKTPTTTKGDKNGKLTTGSRISYAMNAAPFTDNNVRVNEHLDIHNNNNNKNNNHTGLLQIIFNNSSISSSIYNVHTTARNHNVVVGVVSFVVGYKIGTLLLSLSTCWLPVLPFLLPFPLLLHLFMLLMHHYALVLNRCINILYNYKINIFIVNSTRQQLLQQLQKYASFIKENVAQIFTLKRAFR